MFVMLLWAEKAVQYCISGVNWMIDEDLRDLLVGLHHCLPRPACPSP